MFLQKTEKARIEVRWDEEEKGNISVYMNESLPKHIKGAEELFVYCATCGKK